MKRFFTIILIVFLPLYFLLLSVQVNTFNQGFYLKSFEEYGVLDVTGKSIDELEVVTEDLLSYLKNEDVDEEVLTAYFNEREIKHLEDVKFLFQYGFIIKNIAFFMSLISIFWLFFRKKTKGIGRSVFYGNFIWWGSIIGLFVLSTLDFNKYFIYFHLIFFNNDLWILNPKTDLLIQMLPQDFFVSIFIRIVLSFICTLAVIQIISFMLMKRETDEKVLE